MKNMVLLRSTSVVKDTNNAPSLFVNLFIFLSLFSPYFFFSFFFFFSHCPESHPDLWGNHSLHHPFLTWDNALIMIITLYLLTTQELQLDT